MQKHGFSVEAITIGKGYNDLSDVLNKEFSLIENSVKLSDYDGYSDASEQYVVFNKKRQKENEVSRKR